VVRKKFPRKEVYVYTAERPLDSNHVKAVHDRGELKLSDNLEKYAQERWDNENKGWINSVIPSAVDVEFSNGNMIVHCAVTKYHKMLGMVKLAIESGETDGNNVIQGSSTEILPIFADDTVILEQRQGTVTQHGVGFYDFPSASKNAEMYLCQAETRYPGLVKGMFDMIGFPKFHLLRVFKKITQEQIKDMFYVGFSKGFEVGLETQFNGYTHLPMESQQVTTSEEIGHRLIYKTNDFLDVLDSIGNGNFKADINGKKPNSNPQTKGFSIVDESLGTILSAFYHIKGLEFYNSALDILNKKGYKINEVPYNSKIHLNDLL